MRSAGTERWSICELGATTADLETMQLREPLPSSTLTLEQKGRITYLSVCTGCHTYAARIVGPPVAAIQALYAGKPEEMVRWVKQPTHKRPDYPEMPPQDYLPDEVLLEVAKYILAYRPE